VRMTCSSRQGGDSLMGGHLGSAIGERPMSSRRMTAGAAPFWSRACLEVTCADASRGVIDRVGTEVTNLKVGDRVVVSFNIACGTCKFCQKKYSSMFEYTNNSSMMEQMYGQRDSGFFGYGHLSGLLSPHPISPEPVLTMRFLEGMRAFSTK
jgi:hypothetical protein